MTTRSRLASLAALALLVATTAMPAAAASPDAARRVADAAAYHGRLLVTWRGPAPAEAGVPGVAASLPTERPMRSVVVARTGRAADVAARLRADPRVLAVVPDAKMQLADWPADAAPDDTLYPTQVDFPQMHVPEAWQTTIGDADVVVAVIDTGLDTTHPDLAGVSVVDPRDVVWNNADVTDEIGHGTAVAGSIVAATNNGVGLAGVAPASSVMPIKVTDDMGDITFGDLLDAVDWAREHGADIINISITGGLSLEQVALGQPTFTAAREAGILVVAASGNGGSAYKAYPASFNGVVSVGAVDDTDTIADFSTYGRALDLVAPGVDVPLLAPDGDYMTESGTSFASPRVAGIAALVEAARPALTVEEVEAVLRASAVDLGDPGRDDHYGDGRVDAAAALAEPVPDPIPVLDPPAPYDELTLTFLAPAALVRQVSTSYTVRLGFNHPISDGLALMGTWPLDHGQCAEDEEPDVVQLDLATEMPLTGLRRGSCNQVYVVAVDEDGNFVEDISAPIIVLDHVRPTVTGRWPAAGATRVDRDRTIKVRFSEPVSAPAGSIRLRNTRTGLTVRVRTRYDAETRTVTLDPVLRMYAFTTYRVEVTSRVVDGSGNAALVRSWTFKTGGS